MSSINSQADFQPTTNDISAEIVQVESPFPAADSAHKGAFAVTNHSTQDRSVTGYVVEFVATADGQDTVLKTDDSSKHVGALGYTRVMGGTFLFLTEKHGMCIEEINLSDFPVALPAQHTETIHFYLHDIDIAAALASPANATFQMRLTVRLEDGTSLQAEKEIEVTV